jgi:hypothetical protein
VSPSKHIRSKNPAVSGGGGGTTTQNVPSARWSEDANCDDALGSVFFANPENATADDILALVLFTNPENAQIADARQVPLMAPKFSEDATVNDLTKVRLVTVDVSRTGTPDSDPMFDAYGDQALGTTNFGNANLQVKKNAPAASTEKRAWLAIDLTNYTPWTAGGTGLSLTFTASTTLLALTQNMTWAASRSAAKPFVESTVTFNAPPTAGTAVDTGTVAVSATPTVFTITVTAANLGAALGQWLMFTFTVTDATDLGIDTVTITSRDQASARPTYTLDFMQRGT